jgi:hypothetical protein
MNKVILSLLAFALGATNAFAHGGHTEKVDGHTHALVDLVLMNAAPVALLIGAFALIAIVRGRKS